MYKRSLEHFLLHVVLNNRYFLYDRCIKDGIVHEYI